MSVRPLVEHSSPQARCGANHVPSWGAVDLNGATSGSLVTSPLIIGGQMSGCNLAFQMTLIDDRGKFQKGTNFVTWAAIRKIHEGPEGNAPKPPS